MDNIDQEIAMLPWQQEVMSSLSRHRVVVGGRRIGMTTLAIAEAKLAIKEERNVLYILPNHRMGNRLDSDNIRYLFPHSPNLKDESPDLLIIDGLAYIPHDEMPSIAMLIARSRHLLLMGTPHHIDENELNWLQFFCVFAMTNPDWTAWQIPTTEVIGKIIDAGELEQIRRDLTDSQFRSQFLAEWVTLV